MFNILTDSQIADLIDIGLKGKADFAEVYIEKGDYSSLNLLDNRVIGAKSSLMAGVGIRLMSGVNSVYVYSDDTSFDNTIRKHKYSHLRENDTIETRRVLSRSFNDFKLIVFIPADKPFPMHLI